MMAQRRNGSTLNRHGSVSPIRPRGPIARAAVADQRLVFAERFRPTWTSLCLTWAHRIFLVLVSIIAVGIGAIEMSGVADGGIGSPTSPQQAAAAAVQAGAAAGLTQEQVLIQMQAQMQVQQDMLLQQQAQMQDVMAKLAESNARTLRAEEERHLALKALSRSEELVDARGVGQPFKFSGKVDQDFSEWDHKMRTFLRAKFRAEVDTCFAMGNEAEEGDHALHGCLIEDLFMGSCLWGFSRCS